MVVSTATANLCSALGNYHYVRADSSVLYNHVGGPVSPINWESFAPGCTRSHEEKLAAVVGKPASLQTIEGLWMTRWETVAA